MNHYIIVLKGNNKDLAIAEFQTLMEVYFNENEHLIHIANTIYSYKTKHEIYKNKEFLSRLTYTNSISKVIFKAESLNDFIKNIKIADFQKCNQNTFVVRKVKAVKTIKTPYSERELAKPIWDNLQTPKVDAQNPDIIYNFFFFDNSTSFEVAELLFVNDKDYLDRMPLKRPVKMPYTLKSDMARCSINLLKLKEGIVLDPFCGIGGILLEAYDMGFQIIGNDISYNDLKYFKQNFAYFYPNSIYTRTLADSQTQFLKKNLVDGIVSDIPYGKCSRKLGKDLYDNFLRNAKTMLKPNKRIVIIYANFTDFKPIALKYFNEVCEITEYINKSMTRHILVLENKK